MSVRLPPDRSGAARNRAQACKSASACVARARNVAGGGVPAGQKGGLAKAWAIGGKLSANARSRTSPVVTVTRAAMPLAAALAMANSAKAGSRSTANRLTPGTRAARQRKAAPLPQPPSNTRSAGAAGTAAASRTASSPARRPSRGCRSRTRPSSNRSSVQSPMTTLPRPFPLEPRVPDRCRTQPESPGHSRIRHALPARNLRQNSPVTILGKGELGSRKR